MIARILLFLLLIPVVEIFAFKRVFALLKAYWGAQMAVELMILALIVLGYVGIKVIKRQSASLMRDFKRGGAPSEVALSGVVLIVSGVLLLIPGFVTDIVAFLILLPPVRPYIARRMSASILRRFMKSGAGFKAYDFRSGKSPFDPSETARTERGNRRDDRVIDVEVLEN